MIVMKAGQRNYRVVIRSRNQKTFRIMRVECAAIGFQDRTSNTAAALVQTVEVESGSVPRSGSGRGVITVFTDHPAQKKVDVPFVVVD